MTGQLQEQTQEHHEPRLADDVDMPQLGDIIGERYEVMNVVGEGGFAAVYRCHDLRTKTDVAIKVLDPMMSRRGEFSARFLREIETVSSLRHHNTIKIFDSGETDKGCLYLVMELLKGEALDEILEREGALPPAQVERILEQVLKSLVEAHQNGIMHRDLKPANVFIAELPGEIDYVKVLDFGIAKSRDEGADTSLTATGQVMCSPDYVAPERVRDHVCFFSSDLYSLGIMMIEMLEGELPYKGETPIMVALQHARTDSPVPLRPYTENGPLGAIVKKAVHKDASERYQSAEEMLTDLIAAKAACVGVPAMDPSTAEAAPVTSGGGASATTYIQGAGSATVTDLGTTGMFADGTGQKKDHKMILLIGGIAAIVLLAVVVTLFVLPSKNPPIEDTRAEDPTATEVAAVAVQDELPKTEEPAVPEEIEEEPLLPAILTINTSPQGASVFFNDGERMGSSPYVFSSSKLPEFPLTIRVEKEGYDTLETTFETTEDIPADADMSFTLVETPKKAPANNRRSSRTKPSTSSSGSGSSGSSSSSTTKEEKPKPSSGFGNLGGIKVRE